MTQIKEATENLIKIICESDVYREYENCKEQLNRYPELKRKTDEFRSRNFEIQNSQADVYSEADYLQKEYRDILNNPMVRSYLDAENAFCKIMQQINYKLIEELEFEVDFMND